MLNLVANTRRRRRWHHDIGMRDPAQKVRLTRRLLTQRQKEWAIEHKVSRLLWIERGSTVTSEISQHSDDLNLGKQICPNFIESKFDRLSSDCNRRCRFARDVSHDLILQLREPVIDI
ncbi:MAG: hypothetical protein ACI92S_002885 [Planctomycetaceae bacterium]|jgi:hypothetical protein